MTKDTVFMDFEDPDRGSHPWDNAPRGSGSDRKNGRSGDDEPGDRKAVIPVLPTPQPMLTGDEVRSGVTDRNRAAAKLRTKGYSYLEIADMLEFEDARAARRAVESVIAATLAPEEIEIQRALVLSRMEEQFRQSFAMGHADYLVDDEQNRIPNERKLQWHQQASADLMAIATLTGAKAPTKVEITPGDRDLERIVNQIILRSGHEDIVDADVIEMDAIPEITAGDDDDGIYG